jgi:CubicO group peptidase (beta-lactamase class C family)
VLVHRDSLLFERYGEGFEPDSVSNSFSVAKSIVNILTGIALKQGRIDSLGERVAEYLPPFREGRKKKIRIRDLMSMRSGLNWEESGADPFSHNARAYYGSDLQGLIEELRVVEEPGTRFDYQSGNTLILGALLRKATGRKLSEYAEQHLWQPIGAVHPAFWNLDREEGMEKAFCCFYAVPKDFARIGKLYLQKGSWQGKQLVDSSFVERSLSASGRKGKKTPFYGHFWWLDEYEGMEVFYARGILGQYIIVVPEKELIIVRTGRVRADKNGSMHPPDLYRYLEVAFGFLGKSSGTSPS